MHSAASLCAETQHGQTKKRTFAHDLLFDLPAQGGTILAQDLVYKSVQYGLNLTGHYGIDALSIAIRQLRSHV